MDTRGNIIVSDAGTGYLKCGFAGAKEPAAVFPTALAYSPLDSTGINASTANPKKLVGYDAINMGGTVPAVYPISCGIIRDFDAMCHIWDHAFNNILRIQPEESRILHTYPALVPKASLRQLLEVSFERYKFTEAYLGNQAVLSLYLQGLLTGLVVDAGASMTNITPVIDGFLMPHLVKRLDIGGRDIARYVIRLLLLRGYAVNRTVDLVAIEDLVRKLGYVSMNWNMEYQDSQQCTTMVADYVLPDGRELKVDHERFMGPEALFMPSVIDSSGPGLSELIFSAIQGSPNEMRPEIYKHVVLCGGLMNFPGIATRIETDVRRHYLERVAKGNQAIADALVVRTETPHKPQLAAFQGGSVLADLMKDKTSFWATKKEWEEHGPDFCLRKIGVAAT